MVGKKLLLLLFIGLSASCGQGTPEIEYKKTKTFSDCPQVEKDRQSLKYSAVNFFIEELGMDVKKISIQEGVICDGKIIYAIAVEDPISLGQVWFVEFDLQKKTQVLHRPE